MKKRSKEVVIFSGKESLTLIGIILCLFIIMLLNAVDFKQPCLLQCNSSFLNKKNVILEKTNNEMYLALIQNDYVSEHIRRFHVWEENTTNFILKNIKPGDTVVECGANIGYYTTMFAKLVTDQGRVYAYEANDEVLELAILSLKMNDLSKIVNLKRACISNKLGIANFIYYSPDAEALCTVNMGMAHVEPLIKKDKNRQFQMDNTYAKLGMDVGKVKQIQTISLDDDLKYANNINWLKMDIEGAEILAIQGAHNLIESSPNLKIIMEWSPSMMSDYGDVEELIDYLLNLGFSFYSINNDGSLGQKWNKKELLAHNINGTDLVLIREKING